MKKNIRNKDLRCCSFKNSILFIILLMVAVGIVYFAVNSVSETGKAVLSASEDSSIKNEPYNAQEIMSKVMDADNYVTATKDTTSFTSVRKTEKTETKGEPATAAVSAEQGYDGYIIEFNEQPVIDKKAELDKEITKLKGGVESARVKSLGLAGAKREAKLNEISSLEVNIKKKEKENINALKLQEQKISSEHKKAIPLIEQASRGAKVSREYKKVFNGVSIKITDEDAQKVKSLPNVKSVYPNNKVNALLMDSIPSINADYVWNLKDASGDSITGKGVKIAIIDTGVDYTHPDLGGCFGEGCKVAGGYDLINYDKDPIDDNGHGTHVAGIAAGNGALKGVAPDTEIYAYKVLDSGGSGTFESVISGIEMAVDPNGDGDFSDHADIISMSLGGQGNPDDPVSRAVDKAVDAGVIVTVAAGNSGPNPSTISSPGTARKAITVGAIIKYGGLAYFSSRGPVEWNGNITIKPDIVAPGVNICSAQHDSAWDSNKCFDESHIAISGTSMATPHVAGAAALIKQAHPDWSPTEVKMALRSYAKREETFSLTEYGHGTLEVLDPVQSGRPCVAEILTNGEASGTINITGSAYCSGAGTYTMYYKPVTNEHYDSSGRWSVLSNLQGPVFNDVLYTMDTTNRQDIVYLIKLVAAENGVTYEDYTIIKFNNLEISRIGENLNYLKESENIYGSIKLPVYTEYKVEYQQEVSSLWTQICNIKGKPDSNILCQVDVSSLPNGVYNFRLAVRKGPKWYYDIPFKAVVLKDLMQGWPIELDGFPRGNALVIDSDNDGRNDLIAPHFKVCGGTWCMGSSFYIFKADGSSRYLDTFYNNGMPVNIIDDSIPSAYNYNGESLIALSGNIIGVADFNGNYKPGWPFGITWPDYGYPPVVIDGAKEFGSDRLFSSLININTFELSILGFDSHGNTLANFPIKVQKEFSGDQKSYSYTLGLGLLRTDGIPNIGIVVAEYYFDENWGTHMKLYIDIYSQDGNLIKRAYLFDDSERAIVPIFSYFALGDLNSDGNTEAVVTFGIADYNTLINDKFNIEGYYTHAYVISSNGDIISKPLEVKGYMPYMIAIGNFGYGNPDIIMALSDTWPTTYNGQKIMAFDYTGNILFDKSLEDYNYIITGLIVGDVDSDKDSEVIVAYRPRWYNKQPSGIIVYDKSGSPERKIEIPTFGEVDEIYNPILSDFNNDGNVDLVLQSMFIPPNKINIKYGTRIFAIDLSGKYKKGMDWPMVLHDTEHTARYTMDCVPKSCQEIQCGTWPDGCGNNISCGECPLGYICNQGTCEIAPECTDSDSGKDYYTKGTAYGEFQAGEGPEIKEWTDYCIDSTNLNEFSCRSLTYPDSDPLSVWSDSYQCPGSCTDGACTETKCQILDVYSKKYLFFYYEIYITTESLPPGDEYGIIGARTWDKLIKFKPYSQEGKVTTLKSTKKINKAEASYITKRKDNIKITYKDSTVCPG